MSNCVSCKHYEPCAGEEGLKGGTSMPDKTSEVVTVSLPWYEMLIATYAKLEAVRQLVRHMSKTYNKELDLLKAVLEEEEAEDY